MVHTQGLCAFCLTGVNGNNTATDRFCHIGTGVDRNYNDSGCPHIRRGIGKAKAVENEHGLEHHGCSPEHFHIDPHDDANQLQSKPLEDVIPLGIGNGIEHTAQKTDHTTG